MMVFFGVLYTNVLYINVFFMECNLYMCICKVPMLYLLLATLVFLNQYIIKIYMFLPLVCCSLSTTKFLN